MMRSPSAPTSSGAAAAHEASPRWGKLAQLERLEHNAIRRLMLVTLHTNCSEFGERKAIRLNPDHSPFTTQQQFLPNSFVLQKDNGYGGRLLVTLPARQRRQVFVRINRCARPFRLRATSREATTAHSGRIGLQATKTRRLRLRGTGGSDHLGASGAGWLSGM